MKNILLVGTLCSMLYANYSAAPLDDYLWLSTDAKALLAPVASWYQKRVVCTNLSQARFLRKFGFRLEVVESGYCSDVINTVIRDYVEREGHAWWRASSLGIKTIKMDLYREIVERCKALDGSIDGAVSARLQMLLSQYKKAGSDYKWDVCSKLASEMRPEIDSLNKADITRLWNIFENLMMDNVTDGWLKFTFINDNVNVRQRFKAMLDNLMMPYSLLRACIKTECLGYELEVELVRILRDFHGAEYQRHELEMVLYLNRIVYYSEMCQALEQIYQQDLAKLVASEVEEFGRIKAQKASEALEQRCQQDLEKLMASEAAEFITIAERKASVLAKAEQAKLHARQRAELEDLASYGLTGVAAIFERGWDAITSQATAEKQAYEEAITKDLQRKAEERANLLRHAEDMFARVGVDEADCWKSLSTMQDAEWSEIVHAKNRRHLSETAYDTLERFSAYALSELMKLSNAHTSGALRILESYAIANAQNKTDEQELSSKLLPKSPRTTRDPKKAYAIGLHQDPNDSDLDPLHLRFTLKLSGVGSPEMEGGESVHLVATAPAISSDDDSARTQPATARKWRPSVQSLSERSDGDSKANDSEETSKEKRQVHVLVVPVSAVETEAVAPIELVGPVLPVAPVEAVELVGPVASVEAGETVAPVEAVAAVEAVEEDHVSDAGSVISAEVQSTQLSETLTAESSSINSAPSSAPSSGVTFVRPGYCDKAVSTLERANKCV